MFSEKYAEHRRENKGPQDQDKNTKRRTASLDFTVDNPFHRPCPGHRFS